MGVPLTRQQLSLLISNDSRSHKLLCLQQMHRRQLQQFQPSLSRYLRCLPVTAVQCLSVDQQAELGA